MYLFSMSGTQDDGNLLETSSSIGCSSQGMADVWGHPYSLLLKKKKTPMDNHPNPSHQKIYMTAKPKVYICTIYGILHDLSKYCVNH